MKEKRNILQTIKIKQADWIGHVLRRNCLVKHVIVGRMTRMGEEEGDVISYCMTFRK
jgi:hypothetical protein